MVTINALRIIVRKARTVQNELLFDGLSIWLLTVDLLKLSLVDGSS